MLDDDAKCSRCVRESDANAGKSQLARLVLIALVVVGALGLYRVGHATYEALAGASGVSGASTKAASTAPAQNGSRLVVYTTASCGVCRLAKTWMNDHSVAYEERLVDSDDAARRELTTLNKGKGIVVPTFVVDNDEVLAGFDVHGVRLTKSLDEHGVPRSR